MRPANTSYRSFLLRVWSSDDHTETRTSITDIATGETRVFIDINGLCHWLRELSPGDASRAEPATPSRSHLDQP
jgi:hypothetical protein